MDILPYQVYLFQSQNNAGLILNENIHIVSSTRELKQRISENTGGIGVELQSEQAKIFLYETGSRELDAFKRNYAISLTKGEKNGKEPVIIGENTREEKLRKEMTYQVLFFEIVAVGFLGIASILSKEKQMGALQVLGVMPVKNWKFILSKLFTFLLTNLLFASTLVFINIGTAIDLPGSIKILSNTLPIVLILASIMVLIGFFVSLFYKDFKQFGLAYPFIIIILTSPIYLAANTAIDWKWIDYYPFYHLYMKLKEGFFAYCHGTRCKFFI